jgi:hypothetical protein
VFEAGQNVFSAIHGNGVVTSVIVHEDVFYPVHVKFDSGATEYYRLDGKLFILAEQPDLAPRP